MTDNNPSSGGDKNAFEDRIRALFNNQDAVSSPQLPANVASQHPQPYQPSAPPQHLSSSQHPSLPLHLQYQQQQSPQSAQGFVPVHLQHHGLPNSPSSPQSPSFRAVPPPPLLQQQYGQQDPRTHAAAPHQQPRSSYRQPNGPPPHPQQRLNPGNFGRGAPVWRSGASALFDPDAQPPRPMMHNSVSRGRQARYLDDVAAKEVNKILMTQAEKDEKDQYRQSLEALCQIVCEENPQLPKVRLECFGSFASGFASAGSDMDLAIVVQEDEPASAAVFSLMEDGLPRSLEWALLRAGHGARLLTRTRVPIIKVCQSPKLSLLDRLRAEREKWDFLPNEKKYPHLFQGNEDDEEEVTQTNGTQQTDAPAAKDSVVGTATEIATASAAQSTATASNGVPGEQQRDAGARTSIHGVSAGPRQETQHREQTRSTWTRERKMGPLDFPKNGVGIQCDINFFNPLGLHNTQMLRCYSLCDPRVQPMVLFVKSWAKHRRINSSYSGTLSSYGYVLMVLHYLTNIAKPPVLPNLQMPWRPNSNCTPHGTNRVEVDSWVVDFWRNDDEIQEALRNGQMSSNTDSMGSLLAGFFHYYSALGGGPQFHWMKNVLSLRSPGGIVTKESKNWVKAVTEEGEGKKIQHRFLFCIEDPFELTHNVARTVTHNGIVAIRDEFRRASRILQAIGHGGRLNEGDLLAPLEELQDLVQATEQLEVTVKTSVGHPEQQRPGQDRSQQPTRQPFHRPVNGAQVNSQRQQMVPRQQPKPLNIANQEAFPTLSAASAKPMRKGKNNTQTANSGVIDGKKAQEYLEDFRRKKAEAQAEKTASSAVEYLGL